MPFDKQNGIKGSFFVIGGAVRSGAPSYVERQCDHELLRTLHQGQFCYVLTSRQMGKSSLVVHTTNKLRQEGAAVIVWDLTAIGQNLNPEQWYDGLCVRMGEQLEREDALDEFWGAHRNLGPCQRLFAAIREIVLPQVKQLIIFVDEIDMVRSLPFVTDEFFAAVRECYNRRVEDPVFDRMTFCLLGVATPSDLIQDTRMTPFNIGRRIELHDFKEKEAASLVCGLQKVGVGKKHAAATLNRILYWTQGHPYLTQRLCLAVAEGHCHPDLTRARSIDRCCQDLFFSNRARERDDNLIFVRERLLRAESDQVSLLHLYEDVLRGKRVPDEESNRLVSDLHLAGVVKQVKGRLVPRNRIYERAFDRAWVSNNLPDAEVRRQRAAFYRGVMRGVAIGAVMIAILASAILIAMNEADRANQAIVQSHLAQAQDNFSRAQAARQSGVVGQRFESLNALSEARPYYPNVPVLRDEVLASLALPDLREISESNLLNPTGEFDLNLDEHVSAIGETDGTITLRGIGDGEVRMVLRDQGWPVARLCFVPQSTLLLAGYAGGGESQTILWNWSTGQKLISLPHATLGQAVDLSCDGRKLALGRPEGGAVVYELPSGAKLSELDMTLSSGQPRIVRALRFNPTGDLLAESCLDDLHVQVWSLAPGGASDSPLMRFFHRAEVFDLAWHPHGNILATACADFSIYLWPTNDAHQPKILNGHEGGVSALAFNHRGTLIASLGLDETMRLWMPAIDWSVAGRLDGEGFDRLQFSADDGRLMAAGRGAGSACIWEVLGGEYVALPIRGGPVDAWRSLEFSPDNRFLTALDSRKAVVWDTETGRSVEELNFTNAQAALFSEDSASLVASSDAGLLRAMLSNGSGATSFDGEGDVVAICPDALDELGAMVLTQDRSRAAIAHRDEILLVSLSPGRELVERTINVGVYYHHLALHPTGQWLAAMEDEDSSIHLWDLLNDETTENSESVVLPSSAFFCFSPEGHWLVTCWQGKFAFYRVGDWQKPSFQIPRRHPSDQHAPVAFTQDGSIVAVASTRYTIQLFRLNGSERSKPELIATLAAPERLPLVMLTFSADGRHLAAATQNQTIHLWNMVALRDGLAELELHHNWPEYPPDGGELSH